MAVSLEADPDEMFKSWYADYSIDDRNGCLSFHNLSDFGQMLWRRWEMYEREMNQRVGNYEKLEKMADGEVVSTKPDLPNISSGETAGLVRRIARNLVQNTPNVEVISKFNDDAPEGIFAKHVLTSNIIGVDLYSNDMQQNLFSSTKTALTLGFACVLPLLMENAAGTWYMKYDTVHYRDVFPEPGCKDVRSSTQVFVRRYLTEGEVKQLVRDDAHGWDCYALRAMLVNRPRSRQVQSVDYQTKKHHQIPEGYEIITWYSSSGEPFLTFDYNSKMLLRIEKNKHPLKQHPVHFLVLEKDEQQPLGKSQVELLFGRQEFQDLLFNGAMKLWYRNINPSIIGYGTVNSIPNLSPGKYTQISNPNAKLEPFEVNTNTLMQFGAISQLNLGSMVNLVGNADQQMAQNAGQGMSQTPQGVEAQQQMVDITTNNYQKAIEAFFSHYCSYALTIYFAELQSIKSVTPTAEARIRLVQAGMPTDKIEEDGTLDIDFAELQTEYWVRCVPGSLVELEDEKQLRILNELFIPLSQAMPAFANTQDMQMLQQASKTMQYIIKKQIELSGSSSAKDLGLLWGPGDVEQVDERDAKLSDFEERLGGTTQETELSLDLTADVLQSMQDQISMLVQNNELLMKKLGVPMAPSAAPTPTRPPLAGLPTEPVLNVESASA